MALADSALAAAGLLAPVDPPGTGARLAEVERELAEARQLLACALAAGMAHVEAIERARRGYHDSTLWYVKDSDEDGRSYDDSIEAAASDLYATRDAARAAGLLDGGGA
jgi:predicted outer membrane protein